METRTYPYGIFAKLTTATNAEHVTTRHKIHIWMSDLWELKYYGRSRSFTVSHAGAHDPFLTVDDTLRPTFAGELSEPERAILTAAGIQTPDEPKRAPAARTTTNQTVSATPKPARKRRSAEPMAYNSDRHPEQGEHARAIVEANKAEHEAMTARQDAARAKRTAQRPPSGAPPAPLPETEGAIVLDGADLKRALTQLKPAIAKRQALPILECVHLRTEGDRAILTATNLELSIRVAIRATGDNLVTVLPFAALLTSATTGPVTITPTVKPADPTIPKDRPRFSATLASAGRSVTVPGYHPDDYPIIPDLTAENATVTTIERDPFARVLARVAVSAADDDSRPVLAGILVKHEPGRITTAAADGFTLAVDEMATQAEPFPSFIVPARIAPAFHAAVPANIEALTLAIATTGSLLALTWADGQLTSPLIDGTFPDFQQIVPHTFASTITYNRKTLLAAVQTCGTIAKHNNDVLRLTPNPDARTTTLSATAAEFGSTSVDLPWLAIDGETPIVIAFNWRFLADALKIIDRPTVTLGTNGPDKAAKLGTDTTDLTILMPMVDRD